MIFFFFFGLKSTTRMLCISFIWGQGEDYNPGGSISGSAEKPLQRDMGKGQYICDFGEGDIHAIKHTFCKRLLLVMKSRHYHEGF